LKESSDVLMISFGEAIPMEGTPVRLLQLAGPQQCTE
jgi:hypothetical protein